jgi:CRP/FNR family transcriptional regulator, anaerobic regulatory protein
MAQFVEVLAEDDTTDNSLSRPFTPPLAPELRALGVGDYLFKEAESRSCVYRVENGIVVVFERRIGRPANIIVMAGRGDYVGLGCLEQHRDSARAVVDSIVSLVPRSEFALLVERDPKLRQNQDDAINRDFEFGKALANDRGRSAPIESVAAFLVAVSRQNAHEGRDPTVVSDSLKCGIVTNLLDMDISTLSRALLKLQGLGLVEQHPAAGLHLKDIVALERIADGDLQGMAATLDDFPGGAEIGSQPSSASTLSFLRQLAASSGAIYPSSSRGELPEAAWLVSVIGGLSVVGVGLAVIFAIALH